MRGNVAHWLLACGTALLLAGCDRGSSASGASATAPTVAADPAALLAREKACLNCHAAERKLVGPAFADIARRYGASAASQPEVLELLARRIREGGSGAWGVVAMPASPSLSVDQSRELARWVLRHGAPSARSD
jgi:cytochrome c